MRIIPVRRRDWGGRSGKSGVVGEAGSRFSSLGCCLAMGDPLQVKVRILAQMGIRKHPEMGDYNRLNEPGPRIQSQRVRPARSAALQCRQWKVSALIPEKRKRLG